MLKIKESQIALILMILCFSSMILGIFLIPKTSKNPEDAQLVESLNQDRVAVIGLEGIITDSFSDRTPFRTMLNAASLRRNLKEALEDKHTKAVLLRLNSPGGTVATSQELFDLVNEFHAAGKPVVVSMSDVCASGCYYIASAADHIVANRGTITGSIGVISHSLNFKNLMDKIGVQDQTIKAGKYKDLGSGTRMATEEEKKILQALINDSYNQFISDVAKGRHLPLTEVAEHAQGLIYTGVQAKKVKLVDSIGNYDDAKKQVIALLKPKYKKADSIRFEETWKTNSISGFESLFDLSLKRSFGLESDYALVKRPYEILSIFDKEIFF